VFSVGGWWRLIVPAVGKSFQKRRESIHGGFGSDVHVADDFEKDFPTADTALCLCADKRVPVASIIATGEWGVMGASVEVLVCRVVIAADRANAWRYFFLCEATARTPMSG
jgi:hypothetical protein